MWVNLASKKGEVKVDHFINERIKKPNILGFWVKIWCPYYIYQLYGCFWSNVDVLSAMTKRPTDSCVSKVYVNKKKLLFEREHN